MASPPIEFGVQVSPESKLVLLESARRLEGQGYAAITVADHPGSSPSPFPVLAAIAAVTEIVGVGPYVANAGLRSPLELASDVATLDLVSDGRAFLGLGAGHTPAEWTMQGLTRPSASGRVGRMIETADAVRSLLAGERVSIEGDHVTLDDAQLEQPRPIQPRIPLLIGGNNSRLLDYAGTNADIVALSGLGRTLPDGHRHDVKWSSEQIDEAIQRVDAAEAGRDERPVRQALVQVVAVTDRPLDEAAPLAERLGIGVAMVLDAPFVLIGSIDQLVAKVEANRARWGITSYIIRQPSADDLAPLVARL